MSTDRGASPAVNHATVARASRGPWLSEKEGCVARPAEPEMKDRTGLDRDPPLPFYRPPKPGNAVLMDSLMQEVEVGLPPAAR